jgi:antitoxin YefM
MPISTTMSLVRQDLDHFCNLAGRGETVIIDRDDGDPVAMISASELSSLLETMHLIRSPRNAIRLFTALERLSAGSGAA